MNASSTWLAQARQDRTLFFSLQVQESTAWAAARPGSYLLCFPGWYRVDDQGRVQLVGRTSLSERAAPRTSVGAWHDDLELCLRMPLPLALRPYQAQLRSISIFHPATVAALGESAGSTLFPPSSFVQLDSYLYRTDGQGLLHVLGACSPRNAGTLQAFGQVIADLAGITGTIHFLPTPDEHRRREKRGRA
jgi:hypothetical protein